MKLSILIPVFNEEESLQELFDELVGFLADKPWDVELLFVDDGSTDGSAAALEALRDADDRVNVLTFARNFGQTAALAAAIDHATGDVLVPMDADLQNDPADIATLLAKLEEGFDVVSGWRRVRHDAFFRRRLPSTLANRLVSWWMRVPLHDYGCTLKAYRARVIKGIHLYGEMHRFVPVYAAWRGARVTEVVVNHRPRRHGRSKYGLSRTFKVILDLITLKLLGSYSTKPSYLFGGLGILVLLFAALISGGVFIEKVVWDVWPHKMSALLLSFFSALVGVILLMMGLLAELSIRIYHESQRKRIYILKSEIDE